MLCTLAQFKERYGITAATDEAAIASILQGVSAQLGRAAGRVWYGRPCLEKTEITFEPAAIPPYTEYLFLPTWPIVKIESVIETALGDWANGTELVAGADYFAMADRGILARLAGHWAAGTLTVQAVYAGGYTPPSESEAEEWEAEDGEVLLPDDIREAALQQAGFVWQRRASLGLSGESAGGGSVSTYAEDKLLPGVREIMAGYRRI